MRGRNIFFEDVRKCFANPTEDWTEKVTENFAQVQTLMDQISKECLEERFCAHEFEPVSE